MYPRDRITVTVVGCQRAYHFWLTHRRLRIGLALFVGLLVTLLGSLWLISHQAEAMESELGQSREQLSETQQKLAAEVQKARQQHMELYSRNEALRTALQDTSTRLDDYRQGLQTLEQRMEMDTLFGPETDLESRLDAASQTVAERQVMLSAIPSGMPVDFQGITSPYGMRTHPVTGKREKHKGIDMRAKTGTPVVATADGVVEYAGYHRKDGYGNLLVLSHDFGFKSYYAHLDDFGVRVGEYVRKGQVVAYTGNTGLSSGPHLHYEVNHLYRKLDPEPFIHWTMDNYQAIFEKENSVEWDSLAAIVKRQVARTAPRSSEKTLASTAN